MRALLLVASLSLACRSAPAWEPVGGFELLGAADGTDHGGTDRSSWSELDPRELRGWLAEARRALAGVQSYTATLETRERIDEELFPRRVLTLRVGHAPFRVAAETLEPPTEKGQLVWYDESANDGELLAESPGFLGRLVGRVSLHPEGDLAMENRRHPLTDIGLLRLLERLEEGFAPALAQREPPRVRCTTTAIDARPARLVEVLVSREFPGTALVYRFGFDAGSGLLVYYGLAELLSDGPALVEEYLYRDVRLDPGLEPEDFRPPE